MLTMFSDSLIWTDVLKIIAIDLLLSGDNAVVIALACRNLPPAQRRQGVLFGMAGAVLLRIVLTFFAVSLLSVPYVKLMGALLLVWIGIRLMLPDEEHDEGNVRADTRLMGAVKTIIVADFVMSLDNVLGVAAAAKGNVALLVMGLLVSIPLIAWSSQLVLKLIDRFPYFIYAGGALLGYVAGEMLMSELHGMAAPLMEVIPHWIVPIGCAMLVLVIGKYLALRAPEARGAVDLVDEKIGTGDATARMPSGTEAKDE
jgi:YjbE family integral membrane protein